MRKPKSKSYINNLQSLPKSRRDSVNGFASTPIWLQWIAANKGTNTHFDLVCGGLQALKSNTMFRGYQFDIELEKKAFITHLPADMNYL